MNSISDLEIWDHEQLRSSLGAMSLIMPKLIDTFLTQTGAFLTSIQEQSQSQLLLTAHSLKGSAAQLCCKRLARIAAQIELELKQPNCAGIQSNRQILFAEIMAARNEMARFLVQLNGSTP
jgi:HPt (histidine-containing phosphotransfer) domain-containing protein